MPVVGTGTRLFSFHLYGNRLINSQLAPVFKVHLCLLPAVGNICFMNTHTQTLADAQTSTHIQVAAHAHARTDNYRAFVGWG